MEIGSGRTKSIREELDRWYQEERPYADVDWIWGFHQKALERLLDQREPVPFCLFFTRYLLAVHEQEMRPCLPDPKGTWPGAAGEELLRQLESSRDAGYGAAPQAVQKLVDLVFSDFVSNGFGETDEDGKPVRIRGAVNRKLPGKKGVQQEIWWDQEALLLKLCAARCDADVFFAFAFGLHMDYDDIVYFLKKVFRRSGGFNLWNKNEFLLDLTFHYAQGNLFAFYQKLQEAIEDPANQPKESAWMKEEAFATQSIADQSDRIARLVREEKYSLSLDENGELPEQVIGYLCEYKYLAAHAGTYERTAAKEARRLLAEFEKNRSAELELSASEYLSIKDMHRQERHNMAEKRYAYGNVQVFYDPEKGLAVPKGTAFYKIEKETKKRLAFESLEDVRIAPTKESDIDVELLLRCTQEGEKGCIPGKLKFQCDSKCLKDIRNKSRFKLSGREKTVTGKVFAKCRIGGSVPAGTRFTVSVKEEGEDRTVTFTSVKEVRADCMQEIRVRALLAETEALKNEITDCSLPDWRKRFLRLGNTKLSLLKNAEQTAEAESTLHRYLYNAESADYQVEGGLSDDYLEKLSLVLAGTELSDTKLSRIRTGRIGSVSRDDILTLSFLAYMSEVEDRKREADGKEDQRLKEFLIRTNRSLRNCHFYELYAPNPYDALLYLLVSGYEPVEAFQNLWTQCLAYQKRK